MLSFTIKIGNTTVFLTPILIIIGVLLLRYIEVYLRNRALAKNFLQEKTDTKFLTKCYKIIAVLARTEKGRRNVYIYRMMVCATHLADGNEEKAMAEFNAFRRQEYKSVNWLYFLFAQYFSDRTFQKLDADLRARMNSGADKDAAAKDIIREFRPRRTMPSKKSWHLSGRSFKMTSLRSAWIHS